MGDAKKTTAAKKDDKKPAAKKDDKKPAAKKDRLLQAVVKKDEKKPAAPAKKDDKKPAAPAKKDDKKPAAPAKKDSSAWNMDTKTNGETTAWTNWNAYIRMPQVPVDTKPTNFGPGCINDQWKAFFGPAVFGKIDAKARDFKDFKAMFEVLEFLSEKLANGTAAKVYSGLMGKTWYAKLKVHIKSTGLKIKSHFKKVGADIKAGLKKTGAAIKKGAMKIHAHIKKGLHIKVKAPKVTGGIKLKAGGKAKVGGKAKIGGKDKIGGGLKLKAKGPKVTGGLKLKAPKLKVKAKAGGKAKVGLKVKAKKDRRLQKKEDTATPSMTTGKDGLSLNNYTKDVVVPKDLNGDSDQTAPDSSNLLKLAFMTFAMLLTMF